MDIKNLKINYGGSDYEVTFASNSITFASPIAIGEDRKLKIIYTEGSAEKTIEVTIPAGITKLVYIKTFDLPKVFFSDASTSVSIENAELASFLANATVVAEISADAEADTPAEATDTTIKIKSGDTEYVGTISEGKITFDPAIVVADKKITLIYSVDGVEKTLDISVEDLTNISSISDITEAELKLNGKNADGDTTILIANADLATYLHSLVPTPAVELPSGDTADKKPNMLQRIWASKARKHIVRGTSLLLVAAAIFILGRCSKDNNDTSDTTTAPATSTTAPATTTAPVTTAPTTTAPNTSVTPSTPVDAPDEFAERFDDLAMFIFKKFGIAIDSIESVENSDNELKINATAINALRKTINVCLTCPGSVTLPEVSENSSEEELYAYLDAVVARTKVEGVTIERLPEYEVVTDVVTDVTGKDQIVDYTGKKVLALAYAYRNTGSSDNEYATELDRIVEDDKIAAATQTTFSVNITNRTATITTKIGSSAHTIVIDLSGVITETKTSRAKAQAEQYVRTVLLSDATPTIISYNHQDTTSTIEQEKIWDAITDKITGTANTVE